MGCVSSVPERVGASNSTNGAPTSGQQAAEAEYRAAVEQRVTVDEALQPSVQEPENQVEQRVNVALPPNGPGRAGYADYQEGELRFSGVSPPTRRRHTDELEPVEQSVDFVLPASRHAAENQGTLEQGVAVAPPASGQHVEYQAQHVIADAVALPASVQRLQSALARDYLRAKDDMGPEMMPKGIQPTVDNVQVNLVMLPRGGLRQEFADQTFSSHGDLWRVEHVFAAAADSIQTIQLLSLFPSVSDPASEDIETVGILAAASAGCGKTFVFTLVAPWKWAKKEMWQEFDIVVARALRCEDVRNAKGLVELLALDRYGIAMDSDRQSICDYVGSHPERTCIILDGLDETTLQDCSEFVQRVLSGQTLPGIRLIITSRPCPDMFALSETRQFQHRVELVGFQPSDVETYVRKVLPVEEAEALLVEVGTDQQLASMMATPFIAKETCRVYHHDRFVPRCVADLFERMIVRVASLRARRPYKNWTDIPAKIRNVVLNLGSFAFDMLIQQRLIFTEKDIQEHSISKEAIALGLLVACDPCPKDPNNHWRFSHLTMQESLAAKYQVCCKPMTVGRVVRLVEGLGPLSGHLRMFWILLAAQLNKACAECLINSLMTRKKTRDWLATDMYDDEFCLSDPFPLNYISPLCEVMCGSQPHRLAEELLHGTIGARSAQHFVEDQMKRSSRSSNVHFLHTLFTTWVAMDSEADEGKLVAAIKKTKRASASFCTDSIQDHRITTGPQQPRNGKDENTDRRQLAFLCFAEYSLHQATRCSPLPSIEASLSEWDGLCHPVILDGMANPAECRAVGTVLQHHPHSVKRVRLIAFSPTSSCRLPSSLSACTAITHLAVHQCDGQWDAISAVVSRSSPMLVTVDVGTSPASDADIALFVQSLSMCRALRELNLIRVVLTPSSGVALADIMATMPTIRRLELIGNSRLGDVTITRLCQALASCSEMSLFNVEGCGLSASSLPALTAAVRSWKNLIVLHVKRNDFTAASAAQVREFSEAISSHHRLRHLYLPKYADGAKPSLFHIMVGAMPPRAGLYVY